MAGPLGRLVWPNTATKRRQQLSRVSALATVWLQEGESIWLGLPELQPVWLEWRLRPLERLLVPREQRRRASPQPEQGLERRVSRQPGRQRARPSA